MGAEIVGTPSQRIIGTENPYESLMFLLYITLHQWGTGENLVVGVSAAENERAGALARARTRNPALSARSEAAVAA